MTEPLDAEGVKLIVLARAAMTRAEAAGAAAVRDAGGPTYAAASTAATGSEAAVPFAGSAEDPGIAAVRELFSTAAVIITDGAGYPL